MVLTNIPEKTRYCNTKGVTDIFIGIQKHLKHKSSNSRRKANRAFKADTTIADIGKMQLVKTNTD